jgi:hypothetical protein
MSGAGPGFQVRGADLKKLRRAGGGANIFGVFRVKNHDFTPKYYIFSNFMGGGGAPPGFVPGASIQKRINIDRRILVEILVLCYIEVIVQVNYMVDNP